MEIDRKGDLCACNFLLEALGEYREGSWNYGALLVTNVILRSHLEAKLLMSYGLAFYIL
jgi:hypothetical protein